MGKTMCSIHEKDVNDKNIEEDTKRRCEEILERWNQIDQINVGKLIAKMYDLGFFRDLSLFNLLFCLFVPPDVNLYLIRDDSMWDLSILSIKKDPQRWRNEFIKIINSEKKLTQKNIPEPLIDSLRNVLDDDLEYNDYLRLAIIGYILHAIA